MLSKRLSAALLGLSLVAVSCGNDGGSEPERDDTGSPPAGNADLPEIMGVEGNTVTVALHTKLEPCGPDPSTAGAGVMTDDSKDAFDEFIGFFNTEVLPPTTDWQLDYVLVDDGGAECPEKAQAAAQQIIREIRPFAVFGNTIGIEEGPVLARAVVGAGIRHIGVNFDSIDELEEYRGLAFNTHTPADLAHEYLAGYIAKRLKDTQAPDPEVEPTEQDEGVLDRVYGMVVHDSGTHRQLADAMAQRLADEGIELSTYFVPTDPGVAAQQMTTLVSSLREDGVNTLVWELYAGPLHTNSIALTQTLASQQYYPELLIATYGIGGQDTQHEPAVWSRARGISTFEPLALRVALLEDENGALIFDPAYEESAENFSPWLPLWQDHLGNPGDLSGGGFPHPANVFVYLSMVTIGLLGAGDELTAESFAEGVYETARGEERRCDVWRFFGRDSDYSPYFSLSADRNDGFRKGFTTIYWVNKPDMLYGTGRYESEDNYQYYESGEDLPAEPSHDTGELGAEMEAQPKIGVRPWVSCDDIDAPTS